MMEQPRGDVKQAVRFTVLGSEERSVQETKIGAG